MDVECKQVLLHVGVVAQVQELCRRKKFCLRPFCYTPFQYAHESITSCVPLQIIFLMSIYDTFYERHRLLFRHVYPKAEFQAGIKTQMNVALYHNIFFLNSSSLSTASSLLVNALS